MGKKQAPVPQLRQGADLRKLFSGGTQRGKESLHGSVPPDGGHHPTAGLGIHGVYDNFILSQDPEDPNIKVLWASSPRRFSPIRATEKQAKADSHGSQGPASASQRSQPGVAVSKKPRMHIAVVQQQQQLQQQQAGSHQDSGSQAADDFLEMLLAGPKSSNSGSVATGQLPAANKAAMAPAPCASVSMRPSLPVIMEFCGPAKKLRAVPGALAAAAASGALAGQDNATAGESGGGAGASASAPADAEDERMLQEVLTAASDVYRTPAATRAKRARGKSGSHDRLTAGGASGASLVTRGQRAQQRAAGSAGKQRTPGRKRKALMDILDEVDLFVRDGEVSISPPASSHKRQARTAGKENLLALLGAERTRDGNEGSAAKAKTGTGVGGSSAAKQHGPATAAGGFARLVSPVRGVRQPHAEKVQDAAEAMHGAESAGACMQQGACMGVDAAAEQRRLSHYAASTSHAAGTGTGRALPWQVEPGKAGVDGAQGVGGQQQLAGQDRVPPLRQPTHVPLDLHGHLLTSRDSQVLPLSMSASAQGPGEGTHSAQQLSGHDSVCCSAAMPLQQLPSAPAGVPVPAVQPQPAVPGTSNSNIQMVKGPEPQLEEEQDDPYDGLDFDALDALVMQATQLPVKVGVSALAPGPWKPPVARWAGPGGGAWTQPAAASSVQQPHAGPGLAAGPLPLPTQVMPAHTTGPAWSAFTPGVVVAAAAGVLQQQQMAPAAPWKPPTFQAAPTAAAAAAHAGMVQWMPPKAAFPAASAAPDGSALPPQSSTTQQLTPAPTAASAAPCLGPPVRPASGEIVNDAAVVQGAGSTQVVGSVAGPRGKEPPTAEAPATAHTPAGINAAAGRGPAAAIPAADPLPAAAAAPAMSLGSGPTLAGGREAVYYEVMEVQGGSGHVSLRLHSPYQGKEVWAQLHDMWTEVEIKAGDSVNVLGGCTEEREGVTHITLDYKHGFLILHPDTLLSGTSITSAMHCTRQAWLSERLGGGPSNDRALMGSLLHELLQRALRQALEAGAPSQQQLVEEAFRILSTSGESLLEVGLDEIGAEAQLATNIPALHAWLHQYAPGPVSAPFNQQQQPQGHDQQQQPQGQQQQQQQQRRHVWQPPSLAGLGGRSTQPAHPWQPKTTAPVTTQPWQQQQNQQRTYPCPGTYGSSGDNGSQQQHLHYTQQQQQQNQQQQHCHPTGGAIGQGVNIGNINNRDCSGGGGPQLQLHAGPRPQGISVHDPRGAGGVVEMGASTAKGSRDAVQRVRVIEVTDIEESIWAPRYGLKGQIDGSLTVRIAAVQPGPPSGRLGTAPGYAGSNGRASSARPAVQVSMHPSQQHGMAAHGQAGGMDGQQGQQGQSQQQRVGPSQPWQRRSWSAGDVEQAAVELAGGAGGGVAGGCDRGSGGGGVCVEEDGVEVRVVPFEFKSGREYVGHRAQVLLYLLLMEERYGAPMPLGLLWNVHGPTMTGVRYAHHELASLLVHRNKLASHLVGAAHSPPPPLHPDDAERACAKCHAAQSCALYARAQPGNVLEGGMGSSLAELASGIEERHAAFYSRWSQMVDLEQQVVCAGQSLAWTLPGAVREAAGACIAGLHAARKLGPQPARDGTIRYAYAFSRGAAHPVAASTVLEHSNAAAAAVEPTTALAAAGENGSGDGARSHSVAGNGKKAGGGGVHGSGGGSGGFTAGDMALLSVEGMHPAAARVFIESVTDDCVVVVSRKEFALERLIRPKPSPHTPGTCTAGPDHAQHSGAAAASWRLDKDESVSTFVQMRSNLATLCAGAGALNARLRQLVVDLDPPRFSLPGRPMSTCEDGEGSTGGGVGSSCASLPMSSCYTGGSDFNSYLERAGSSMNEEQMAAVQRVLHAQDYTLVLGMPGTGKTTTIVHTIRALLEQGCRVLISAYTNSAVDNILLKLLLPGPGGVDLDPPERLLRLGSHTSVHPAVLPYLPGGVQWPGSSSVELASMMSTARVVGCTCLSMRHAMLTGASFDVAIVDEAGQATLPSVLGALCAARSWVLVGDHLQLSPLVRSKAAAAQGLSTSLFKRLGEAHPQAVVTLRCQYRMAADIMLLANTLVYNGALQAGNAEVASATMHLPYLPVLCAAAAAAAGGTAAQEDDSAAEAVTAAACAGADDEVLPGWLLSALQPEQRVLFLDTDGVEGAGEASGQDAVTNPGEVRLLHALVHGLLAAGASADAIGVVSPYRAQVAAIQAALTAAAAAAAAAGNRSGSDTGSSGQELHQGAAAAGSAGSASAAGASSLPSRCSSSDAGLNAVEVSTVDKYQGRDKDAILISMVRSNAGGAAGKLLSDVQRINVALTRARSKLLMVGSSSTLAAVPVLAQLLTLLREKGWIRVLPTECLQQLKGMQ